MTGAISAPIISSIAFFLFLFFFFFFFFPFFLFYLSKISLDDLYIYICNGVAIEIAIFTRIERNDEQIPGQKKGDRFEKRGEERSTHERRRHRVQLTRGRWRRKTSDRFPARAYGLHTHPGTCEQCNRQHIQAATIDISLCLSRARRDRSTRPLACDRRASKL